MSEDKNNKPDIFQNPQSDPEKTPEEPAQGPETAPPPEEKPSEDDQKTPTKPAQQVSSPEKKENALFKKESDTPQPEDSIADFDLEEDPFDDSDDLDSEFDDDLTEDIGGEDWDDFDEPAAGKKKPFFLKHFNTIITTLAVLIGGGIFYNMILSPLIFGSPQQRQETTAEETAQKAGDRFQTATDDALDNSLPQPSPITPPSEEALTPMPDSTELAVAEDASLPNLKINPGEEELAMKGMPDAAETDIASSEKERENQAADGMGEAGAEEDFEDPLAGQFSGQSPPENAESANEKTTEVESVSLELPEPPEETLTPVEEVDSAAVKQGKTKKNQENSEQTTDIKASRANEETTPQAPDEETTAALNEELIKQNRALEKKIDEANQKISNLAQLIEGMEQKLEQLNKIAPPSEPENPVKEDVRATVQQTAHGSESSAPPAIPVKRPETLRRKSYRSEPSNVRSVRNNTFSQTASQAVNKNWILRSAQPGRAVVSDKNTGDLRSIETGSTLPGVGKILSIGMESGRWVVTGTQSRITQ